MNGSIIPDIGDKSAKAPTPGVPRISAEAASARLRRVMEPNIQGQYKVSAEIVAQWKNKKKGRKGLEQLFQSCGFDVDWGAKQVVFVLVSKGLKIVLKLKFSNVFLMFLNQC